MFPLALLHASLGCWVQAELEQKVKMLCLPVDILAQTAMHGNSVRVLGGCWAAGRQLLD